MWKVAISAPIPKHLFYMENHQLGSYQKGLKVKVPLGKKGRLVNGVLLEKVGPHTKWDTDIKYKEIHSVDREHPVLGYLFLEWLKWLSHYYVYPLGDSLSAIFPPLPKKGRKKKSEKEASEKKPCQRDRNLQLNKQQKQCFESISTYKDFSVHLLFGVHRFRKKQKSYLHLFQKVIKEGKKGLFLVPEIALTPQLVERFYTIFSGRNKSVSFIPN